MMAGLRVPGVRSVGRFRSEPGLTAARAFVGSREGVAPDEVMRELRRFERTLRRAVAALDQRYPGAGDLDRDGLAALIDLSAWAHAEVVRIHPFANGNGRTARLLANALLMRHGVPPVVGLRPRPDEAYGRAAQAAMRGDWRPMAAVFRLMLSRVLR